METVPLQNQHGDGSVTKNALIISPKENLTGTIATFLGRHVTAFPPGRFHRAVPSNQNRKAALQPRGLHEMKHDGFRVTARKNGCRVRRRLDSPFSG